MQVFSLIFLQLIQRNIDQTSIPLDAMAVKLGRIETGQLLFLHTASPELIKQLPRQGCLHIR